MTERSKILMRYLLGAAAAGMLAAGVLAQDRDSATQPPERTEAGDEDDLPRGSDDDVFIPTEEIPADEEVTFPVNI